MNNLNNYRRLRIIPLVDKGFLSFDKACQELNISQRHLSRLLKKYRDNKRDTAVLLPKNGIAARNGTDAETTKLIVALKKQNSSRSNQYISELIQEILGQQISYSTVRNILIQHNCYERVACERRVFKRLEAQITQSGEMLQMDTCEGSWLKGYRRVYLIAVMDAFSRYIVGWRWVDSDSAWNNILVLRAVIEQYGVPEMVYTDNASFFKIIRHDKSIYQRHKPEDQYETTIERILLELGSCLISHKPYRPQGKGRIERFFRFMQDRFIAEHTATTLKELNQQFKKWVKWYNTKHIIRTIKCVPKDRFSLTGFRPVLEDTDLNRVFSFQYTRKVDKYNSLSFEGHKYAIDIDKGCFVAFRVQLCVTDKEIAVYYQDELVQRFKRLSKDKI